MKHLNWSSEFPGAITICDTKELEFGGVRGTPYRIEMSKVSPEFHIVIWEERWSTGYQASLDLDRDFVPDWWENSVGAGLGFVVRTWQVPDIDDKYDSSRPSANDYIYQENRCRQVEHNLIETAFDNLDWSYDPTGINQGKQWNR